VAQVRQRRDAQRGPPYSLRWPSPVSFLITHLIEPPPIFTSANIFLPQRSELLYIVDMIFLFLQFGSSDLEGRYVHYLYRITKTYLAEPLLSFLRDLPFEIGDVGINTLHVFV